MKQVKLRYNLYLVDFDKMRELLEQIDWEGILCPLDIHGAWQFVSISYCQARNELQNLTRSLRKTYECSLASNRKVDIKHFWKYVNSHLKVCLSISSLCCDDNSVTYSDFEKCELFNNFFSSVFTSEDCLFIPSFQLHSDNIINNITCNNTDLP